MPRIRFGDFESFIETAGRIYHAGDYNPAGDSRRAAPSHHRDPFDRLLAAQALDLGIPLLSRDRVFDLYGVQRIWD
jgi:predicted nucleic acid-binding protein